MAMTPRRRLPEEVLDRPKTGFSVPVREWLRGAGTAPASLSYRDWALFIYGRQWRRMAA
jgi:asparagine synthase (glutamine-hydrolysing)